MLNLTMCLYFLGSSLSFCRYLFVVVVCLLFFLEITLLLWDVLCESDARTKIARSKIVCGTQHTRFFAYIEIYWCCLHPKYFWNCFGYFLFFVVVIFFRLGKYENWSNLLLLYNFTVRKMKADRKKGLVLTWTIQLVNKFVSFRIGPVHHLWITFGIRY